MEERYSRNIHSVSAEEQAALAARERVRAVNPTVAVRAVEAFAGQLAGYEASKGAIQLPYSKPLPLELIADIAKWCAANA